MPLHDLDLFSGFAMLNLWWIASLLIIWSQRLICHHECLALLPYLLEGHKFLFLTKTFHVPIMNLKMKCKMLGKCAPMSDVLNLIYFGC
jgi:hypothetical protein